MGFLLRYLLLFLLGILILLLGAVIYGFAVPARERPTAWRSAPPQLAHAVAHRALARQHDALGKLHLLGVRGDDHLQVVDAQRSMGHGLRHRAQVAHAVVDDGDGVGHGPRATLWWTGSPRPRAGRPG